MGDGYMTGRKVRRGLGSAPSCSPQHVNRKPPSANLWTHRDQIAPPYLSSSESEPCS